MGVRPKGRVRLLRVRLVGLSVFFLRRRHRRKKTLAQALTGQGRSSSCKIWEAYIQSHVNETFPYTSILLPSGFRSLYGRVLAYHTRVVLGGSRRRSHEGASPLKLPIGSWVVGRHPPLRGGRRKPPRRSHPQVSLTRDIGKERVDGAERPSTLLQVWSIQLPVASIPLSVNESA